MKTLIADDHETVREGFKSILKRLGPDVSVFECGSFPEALELAAHNKDFDLAVFDLLTPDMGGPSASRNFAAGFRIPRRSSCPTITGAKTFWKSSAKAPPDLFPRP